LYNLSKNSHTCEKMPYTKTEVLANELYMKAVVYERKLLLESR